MPPALVAQRRCQTGEGPLWNPDDCRLYWTDIPAGKLYRYDPATGRDEQVYAGEPVGGFTLHEDKSLLLFRVRDVARLDLTTGAVTSVRAFDDSTSKRFNDVAADPRGRVLAGTIGSDDESGGLYRFDLDGTVTKLWSGTGCANGMAWSPDGRTYWWTDTTHKTIYQYDYDAERGEARNRRVFHEGGDGWPDGLALDADGHVWSARYAGSKLLVLGADGKVAREVALPTKAPTSCAFAGETLDALYVTSAEGKPDGGDDPAGGLFRLDPGVRGVPRHRSRVRF